MQELARVGFRVILALSGHYPYCQVIAAKDAAADAAFQSGAWAVALAEYEIALDLGYTGDHAGKWETSIYWHLRPDLVCMENLPADLKTPLVAAGPEDPRVHASSELGETICRAIVDRAAEFVEKLLAFDKDPVKHGPTHTMMEMALRSTARALEAGAKANLRNDPRYHDAMAKFYACEFGKAHAILTQHWPCDSQARR
jgi:hypothetical protein